uniref:Immunoglobulin domain-containing protein n=1 Tax=Cyclopterus lumpus TaxID=8103 RepID=A0A8C2WKN9_CYCLU
MKKSICILFQLFAFYSFAVLQNRLHVLIPEIETIVWPCIGDKGLLTSTLPTQILPLSYSQNHKKNGRACTKVEGFEGGEVSFQCSHRYAWNNNKYLCKDPCKDRQDVLATVQNGGRITLVDSGDGVFIVTFSHLQLSDMGRYWCAVERFGFDTFTEVQVTVQKGTYFIEISVQGSKVGDKCPKKSYKCVYLFLLLSIPINDLMNLTLIL